MKKRVIWAVLAMLGFSTACSTVKQTPQQGEGATTGEATEVDGEIKDQRIVVMYGVPSRVTQPVTQQAETEQNETGK